MGWLWWLVAGSALHGMRFYRTLMRPVQPGLRESAMRVVAIYPGTFDPMTIGHRDVAERASHLFDELVVAVAASANKNPYFDLEERVALAAHILSDLPNVSVRPFGGLLVNFVAEAGASVIVRGLRAISDFEFEVQVAGVNRHLSPSVETIFIPSNQEYSYLSSSVVREVARFNGDISEFVHPAVVEAFRRKATTPSAG